MTSESLEVTFREMTYRVSFDLAKKLKIIGFPQEKVSLETVYFYNDSGDLKYKCPTDNISGLTVAPTYRQAEQYLEKNFGFFVYKQKTVDGWGVAIQPKIGVAFNLNEIVKTSEAASEVGINWCCNYIFKMKWNEVPKPIMIADYETQGWSNIRKCPPDEGSRALFYVILENPETMPKIFIGTYIFKRGFENGKKAIKRLIEPDGYFEGQDGNFFYVSDDDIKAIFWKPLPSPPSITEIRRLM